MHKLTYIMLLLEHGLCELVYYFVLQDLICLMFLLLLKGPTPIRLVSYFALYSYDSIRVARFHVVRGPHIAFVVGSHIQLLVK